MTSGALYDDRELETAGNCSEVRAGGLHVTPDHTGELLVLVVAGEADMDTSQQLQEQIAVALIERPPAAVIDLSRLTFCDLAGMDALDQALRAAHTRGIAVTVLGESAQLAWLHRTFPPAPDTAEHQPPAQLPSEPLRATTS